MGPGRNGVAGELERLHDHPGTEPHRRIETQRLLDRHRELRQPVDQLLGGRGASAEHSVLLIDEARERGGMARQFVEQERERG